MSRFENDVQPGSPGLPTSLDQLPMQAATLQFLLLFTASHLHRQTCSQKVQQHVGPHTIRGFEKSMSRLWPS